MWVSAHLSLFHDTLAGQKTLFLSSHHCQKSPQLHLEGEETAHWNVKIRLHGTELSLERWGGEGIWPRLVHWCSTFNACSALETGTQMPLWGLPHTGLVNQAYS